MHLLLLAAALSGDPCAFAKGEPYEAQCRAQAREGLFALPRGKSDAETRELWRGSWLCGELLRNAKRVGISYRRATLETPKGPMKCEPMP